MKHKSTMTPLILISGWFRSLRTYYQNFHRERSQPSILHFSSNFIGLPYVALFFIALLTSATSYAQNNPNFYLAENGVTCMCPDAEEGETGTLSINGQEITFTKRTKEQLTYENLSTTCTSGISDMSFLFYKYVGNADISHWDVSSVTNMESMFQDLDFYKPNIGAWNVSSVTNMKKMFKNSASFNGNIENWDVSSVTDMSYMFEWAQSFNQDIGNWNVSSVTNMEYMFGQAKKFNQDLNWNVSSVTNMNHMFSGATNFNGDIVNWDIRSVTNLEYIFEECSNFNQPIGVWKFGKNMHHTNGMFRHAKSFNQDISSWDMSKIQTITAMFAWAESFNQDIGNWDTSTVKYMSSVFNGASAFNQDISNWDVSKVLNMDRAFLNATSFNQNLSSWCVERHRFEPPYFADNSPLRTTYKPIWGKCPPSKPKISPIDDQKACPNTAVTISVDISDRDTAGDDLKLYASSRNSSILRKFEISSTGSTRTLKMTPEIDASGKVMVVLTLQNAAGGIGSTSFNVNFQDTEAPIAKAKNISIILDETGKATITPQDIDNGSSDTCGIQSMSIDVTEFDCSHAGDNTVILTVTDEGGNTATAEAMVTVEKLLNSPIRVSTAPATEIAADKAILGGSIISGCDTTVTERGVVWSTNTNPIINHNRVKMGNGPGSFDAQVRNLYPNATIYYKAYVIVDNKVIYGDEKSFKTNRSLLADFSWSLTDDIVGSENVTYSFSFTTRLDIGQNTEILNAIQEYVTNGWDTSNVLLENVTVTINGVERAVKQVFGSGYSLSVRLVNPIVPAGSKVIVKITGIKNSATAGSHRWKWIQTGSISGWEIERAENPEPIILKNRLIEQAFSFPAIAEKTYGNQEFILGDEKTDQGLTIAYTTQDTDVVSIFGHKATILKSGTAQITATQEGDETRAPATSITRTLNIIKAPITIAAETKSKIYGEEDPQLTYQIANGALVGEDDFSGNITREEGEATGSYNIELGSLALSDNYDLSFESASFTIKKATAIITANAIQTLTYDGTIKEVSASLNHSETELVYAPQRGYMDVGTYTVTITSAGTDNYLPASKEVTLIIEKGELTGVAFEGEANGHIFTYDGNPHSIFVTGLSEDATVNYANNGQTDAGIYTVTAKVSKASYNDLVLTAELVINKATPVITAHDVQTFNYDGAIKQVVASLNHSETALSYAPQQSYSNAGTYGVTISADETSNYLSATKDVSLVIKNAEISGVTFGGDVNSNTFTYNGNAHSIFVDNLPEGATVTYANNGQTDAGTYTVTATISKVNFNDLVLTADLIINKAEALITADDVQTFTYDGTLSKVSASLNHAETALTYTPQQGYTNVGTYGVTIFSAETQNYMAAYKEVTLVIENAEISGIVFEGDTNSDGFTYDGNPHSIFVTGLPDDATVTYANNGQTEAGIYTVTATISKANFNDLVLTAELVIKKSQAIITADAVQTFTYDGTLNKVSASLNHAETVLTYTPQQGHTNAGTYTVTISAAETDNYLSASKNVTLVIENAEMSGVTFEGEDTNSNSFIYDGNPHSIFVTGLPEGATVTYANNGQTDAGTYTVTATISKSNYNDLVLTAELLINKAQAIITTDAVQAFTYDGTVKNVVASLNHSEVDLVYATQQGYTNAGTYEVMIAAEETKNYLSASKDVTLVIEKAEISGVAFEYDGNVPSFVYDGTAHSIFVSGLPKEATVTYIDNGQIDAGTYTVTAIISMPNHNDLVLTTVMVINKASQNIVFGELAQVSLRDENSFQLQAEASSGLPVTYSYNYGSENPAATVSPEGEVKLLQLGQITITATQEGNHNYEAAAPITQTLRVMGDSAELNSVVINGMVYENLSEDIYYLIECGNDENEVHIELLPISGASVNSETSFTIATPRPGIYKKSVTVTSEDGFDTKTYHITIEKTFNFEDIVIQKFNNVLLVNNNPETNGGYKFVSYAWYKNGEPIGSGQYYSEGPNASDQIDPDDDYHVVLTTDNGDQLKTCASPIQLRSSNKMFLTPNPVNAGGVMQLHADFSREELETMELSVHTLNGTVLQQIKSNQNITYIHLSNRIPAGVYMLVCRTNTRTKSLKFIVK